MYETRTKALRGLYAAATAEFSDPVQDAVDEALDSGATWAEISGTLNTATGKNLQVPAYWARYGPARHELRRERKKRWEATKSEREQLPGYSIVQAATMAGVSTATAYKRVAELDPHPSLVVAWRGRQRCARSLIPRA